MRELIAVIRSSTTPARLLVGTFISVGIVAILLTQINFTHLWNTVTQVPLTSVLLAFGTYVIINIVRAWRLQLLVVEAPLYYRDVLGITLIHNMLNYLLPARTGELSFPLLMRRYRISLSKGFIALAWYRVFDLLSLAVIVSAILLVFRPGGEIPPSVVSRSAGVVLGVSLTITLTANHLLKATVRIAQWLTSFHSSYLVWLGERVSQVSMALLASSNRIRPTTQVYWGLFVLSGLQWICGFIYYGILLDSLQISLLPSQVVVVSAIASLLLAIPFQGIAGVGTYEGIWVLSLALVNVDSTSAILASLVIHLSTLLFAILLGPIGAGYYVFR